MSIATPLHGTARLSVHPAQLCAGYAGARAGPCENTEFAFLASRRCKNNANVKVKAALTIKPTVTELPTKKRGAYVVSYVISAIQALKAYLISITTNQHLSLRAMEGAALEDSTYAMALVDPRMSLRSRLSPEHSSLTMVCQQNRFVSIHPAELPCCASGMAYQEHRATSLGKSNFDISIST